MVDVEGCSVDLPAPQGEGLGAGSVFFFGAEVGILALASGRSTSGRLIPKARKKAESLPRLLLCFSPRPLPRPLRGGENFYILLKDRSTKGHLQGKNMDKMDCSALPLRLPKNYFATPRIAHGLRRRRLPS